MNKKIIALTFYIIAVILILVLLLLFIAICCFGRESKAEKSDCIIVLGCSVYGNNPSPFLAGRMDEAIRLYNNNYAKYIIVSGGQGKGENITEAEAMRIYAVEHGVKEDGIIKEDKSVSTLQNVKNSVLKMEERGFKSAIIVSNKFHLLRASIIAGRYNYKFSFSGIFMKKHLKSEIIGYLREIPGVMIYGLKIK